MPQNPLANALRLIADARHHDPFTVLGRHSEGEDTVVRAEDVEGVTVPAFAKEMQIEVADLRQESVGVAGEAFAAFAVAPDQRVVLR